ncbi:Outer membrane protein W precursor [Marinomonas spartinae]|uniref:Outer membrane protein W n=1 Tax=Marinomonas spartinae TaxID=1792290 RepID=A0A1A8TAI7_9GAMM|nr:OmpW family outer membrane protein [Marinomonas spartinae]SBS27927.1 Outer membrane protein W precursor [Marinomonas spartinae]SBS28518.1 Outer membrane protein W precursor [Marinomonas spartinae]
MKALLPVALVSALCSTAALAHQAGDFFVRGGVATVMPNESSDDVAVSDNQELKISNDTQLAATLTYMITDNIGAELLLATPFKHDVSTAKLGKVAEVSQLPPSLMAQYYFGKSNSDIRPYVGAGLNHTVFFDAKGKGALAGTNVSVDGTWGLAAQAGVDMKINDKLFANASVWYMNIDTDVHTAVGTISTKVNPLAVMVGVGYTF